MLEMGETMFLFVSCCSWWPTYAQSHQEELTSTTPYCSEVHRAAIQSQFISNGMDKGVPPMPVEQVSMTVNIKQDVSQFLGMYTCFETF